ncbi:hypothetical protein, partial [Zooshikella ganghwensis]|uniref:hypothetical protein n=1 Tax=Zooshikella ganghwensis TaxID=202772 RepID=UPI00048321A4
MRLYQRSICFLAISLFTTFAWGSTYCHSGGGYCSHLHYFEGYERAKTECNKLANVIFGKGENCSKFSPFVRGYQADKYNTASHYLWFLPIYNCPKDGQAIDRDRGCIPKNECALGYIKSSLGNYICNIPTQHAQQEAGNGNCHSPDTTPAAGNPVRIATGNKFHVESVFNDISPLILSYNSSTGKWSHSYFYELHVENGFFFERNNQRPDGQSLVFTKSGDGWTPLAAGAIQLSSTSAHGAAWLVNYYGQHEYYDDQGRILRIEKPQGTSQTFTWSDQQLVVQDQQSNRLTLNFDDKKRLVSAVQPNGKPTTLAWSDDDKLLKVTKSDGS